MTNRILRLAASLVFALGVGAAMVGHAAAERRVALVVGNANYEHAGTLANTINDANAVAAMLKRAGFDIVEERRNAGVVDFKRAIREFMADASTADIAVVYYSGHGIEIGGVNYLIPVDAKLASDFDVDDEAIPLDRLIQATQSAKTLSLIILDACRDNPFLRATPHGAMAKRSIGSRLIGVEPTGADTLIAYAAKAGSVSYDGSGSDSPFTAALVKYLPEPGLDIRIALGKVRDEVLRNTGNRQEPFVYGSLGGDDVALVAAPALALSPPDPNAAAAADYALAERVASVAGWQAFLAAHGSGYYANLARAQLVKLAAADRSASAGAPSKKVGVAIASLENDRGAPAKRAPQATPPLAIETAKLSPDDACKADAARLAQLRLNPAADQAAKFSRELACEDLRPQVNRFLESLGLAPTPAPQRQTATAAVGEKSAAVSQDCNGAARDLARLRANPDRAAAARFAHDLKCDDLKPQAARLLESLGD